MKTRIIELAWECKNCKSKKIPGRHKNCPTCGAARESNEMEMDVLDNSTVIDPELIDLATAGADKFCNYCKSGNRGDDDRCNNCGANSLGDKPLTSIVSLSDFDSYKFNHPSYEDVSPPPPNQQISYNSESNTKLYVGLALSFAIVITLLFTFFRTNSIEVIPVKSLVVNVSTVQERWTNITQTEWQHLAHTENEIKPINGQGESAGFEFLGICTSEHYKNEEYECGIIPRSEPVYINECSRTETYDCGEEEHCSDNGNGFATCTTTTKTCTRSVPDTCTGTRGVFSHNRTWNETKYCTRPIMKPKCKYKTQEWQYVDNHYAITYSASITSLSDAVYYKIPQLELYDRTITTANYIATLDSKESLQKEFTVSHKNLNQTPGSYQYSIDTIVNDWLPKKLISVHKNIFGVIIKLEPGESHAK